ncbi:protein of unknown function DUF6, transmembrane [Roseibacterium elongatum DSM 19469]|uniref:Uncharacterized protein n=1 Tax=Roseicyclus elongatus DSM 19469 TaxID=1294273 RepID=W8RPK7_9RHOB|nr:hypothetical protein [Roseibacterium elongatum]AHM02933.1 protein of unknown function DUF6, transmembrane [Roseibacterium elongatum DSM 19469]
MPSDRARARALMTLALALVHAGGLAGKLRIGGDGVVPHWLAFSRFALGAACLPRDWRVWLRRRAVTGDIAPIRARRRTDPSANGVAAVFIGLILSGLLSIWLRRGPALWGGSG